MNKVSTIIEYTIAVVIGLIALALLIMILGFVAVGAWCVWTMIF